MPGIVSGVGNLAGALVKAPFQLVSKTLETSSEVLGSKKTKKGNRVNKRNSRKSRVVRRRSSSSSRRRSGRRSSRRSSSRGRN